MLTRRLGVLFLMMAIVLAMASTAMAGGRPLSTSLTGAAEVPGPGDPDGTGHISLTINPGRSQVCYHVRVSDVAPITAGHIHEGAVDEAGPVVVDLELSTFDADGMASGCVSATRSVLVEILKAPADYYVNLHNAEFPAGAVRGQLG